MKSRSVLSLSTCVLALAVTGCPGSTTTPGNDAGGTGVDSGGGGMDTGVPNDASTSSTDTGADAGGAADDAGSDIGPTTFPDGAIMCLPGVECTNWAAAIGAAPRNASDSTMALAVTHCVVQLHRSDCCGNMTAYGVNHGARTDLCTAETTCTAMYPTPAGCTGNTITVDTGDTTTDMSLVRVRGLPSTSCSGGVCVDCQTVVCDPADATCLSLEGISATQCG